MTSIPSEETLNKVVERSSRFMTALATRPPLFRVMANRGNYSQHHHQEGLGLLVRSMGIVPVDTPAKPEVSLNVAVARCDDTDDTLIALVEGALEFRHPEAYTFMTHGLKAARGVKAVANIQLIIARIKTMRDDPDAFGGPEVVEAALESLSDYGFDADHLNDLQGMVDAASQVPEGQEERLEALTQDEVQEARLKLYFWHKGWSRVARTLITRRDWLIVMGLARRRRNAEGDSVIELVEETPSVAAPSLPSIGDAPVPSQG